MALVAVDSVLEITGGSVPHLLVRLGTVPVAAYPKAYQVGSSIITRKQFWRMVSKVKKHEDREARMKKGDRRERRRRGT